MAAPAEGFEPPSSWFEARCLSVRPRGRGVPGEIRTRASWLRTRPPGPLVRRGHRELGGTRTLFRQFAANVPRLRTSSGVRPAGVEPALPAWHAGVHPATPRPQTTFRHAVVESNHGLTNLEFVGAPCPPAYRRLVRESNPSPEIDNLLAYPAASRGKVARSCVKARSPAATEVAKGAQLRAVQKNLSRQTNATLHREIVHRVGIEPTPPVLQTGASTRLAFDAWVPRAGIDPAPPP